MLNANEEPVDPKEYQSELLKHEHHVAYSIPISEASMLAQDLHEVMCDKLTAGFSELIHKDLHKNADAFSNITVDDHVPSSFIYDKNNLQVHAYTMWFKYSHIVNIVKAGIKLLSVFMEHQTCAPVEEGIRDLLSAMGLIKASKHPDQQLCMVDDSQYIDVTTGDLKFSFWKDERFYNSLMFWDVGNRLLKDLLNASVGATQILKERKRQKQPVDLGGEGYLAKHDETHVNQEMLKAAMCYLQHAIDPNDEKVAGKNPDAWPWASDAWKPKDRQKDLIRAGALIAAELDLINNQQ